MIFRIKIPKFSDYNPRKDVKASSWFRCQNDFADDEAFIGLPAEAKVVWLIALGMCSSRARDVCVFDTRTCALRVPTSPDRVAAILRTLEQRGKLAIEEIIDETKWAFIEPESDRTSTLRARSDERTDTVRPRIATDVRTDERFIPDNASAQSGAKSQKAKKPKADSSESGTPVWDAYREAYLQRYSVAPIRDAAFNANAKRLVAKVGQPQAVELVKAFMACDEPWLVSRAHEFSQLIQNPNKYLVAAQNPQATRPAEKPKGEWNPFSSELNDAGS